MNINMSLGYHSAIHIINETNSFYLVQYGPFVGYEMQKNVHRFALGFNFIAINS
jgi:hypothetical protein